MRVFASFLLILFSVCLLQSADALDFKVCSGVTDTLNVTAMAFSPENPVANSNLHTEVFGTVPASSSVSGGVAHIQIKKWGVTLTEEVFDVCTLVNRPHTGPFVAKIDYPIPYCLGGVKAHGYINIYNEKKELPSCVEFDMVTASGNKKIASSAAGGAKNLVSWRNSTEVFERSNTAALQKYYEGGRKYGDEVSFTAAN